MNRKSVRQRVTAETYIDLFVDLDGSGRTEVSTGIPFYDHMLSQVGKHGGFDLNIVAKGDIHIDTHHTVEDVAITLGEAVREALGDKAGVRRFASGLYPLDEALVEIALDLSGRPFVVWDVTSVCRSATHRSIHNWPSTRCRPSPPPPESPCTSR
jgi:imidazoleglycerol-phosphate dehydratase